MLQKILKELLLVPMSVIEEKSDKFGSSKVRAMTVEEKGKKFVPVFLDDELLFNWAKKNIQKISQEKSKFKEPSKSRCVPIIGEDLVLMLQNSDGIVLNPELKDQMIFTKDELYKATNLLPISNAPIAINKKERSAFIPDIKELKSSFPEIEELYLKDSTEPLITFVHKSLTPEKRFKLIEKIATISKEHFGEAGLIDVWDEKIDQAGKIRGMMVGDFQRII